METNTEKKASKAARALAKLGASKGGKARAAALTPEERQAIASDASMARWAREKVQSGQEKILKATHGSPDRPLRIGSIAIPCFVLENGQRVISQNGMLSAIDIIKGGRNRSGVLLGQFFAAKTLSPFISNILSEVINSPIRFRSPTGLAYGYEATVLTDICQAILEARKAGALRKTQLRIADRAEILLSGFARVGIIALVDEATGYQEERDKEELHRILEAYISKELLPWAKRFPPEFYQEMFRLRNWPYSPLKGPRLVGKLTNQIVYDKLPPGVLDELKRKNPVIYNGWRKYKHHQFLTDNIGHPHLEKHIVAVTTLMRVASSWREFERMMEKAFPSHKKPAQLEMKLDEGGVYELSEVNGGDTRQED